MNDVRTYSLHIPSERMNIGMVEPFVRHLPELERLGTARFHDMLVALTEAVNNAIIHGHDCNPAMTVDVDVRTSETEVLLMIRDHGRGFNPDAIPDPRHPDHILREGGRGVFLIRHLADVAEFYRTDPGMTVLLKYYFPRP